MFLWPDIFIFLAISSLIQSVLQLMRSSLSVFFTKYLSYLGIEIMVEILSAVSPLFDIHSSIVGFESNIDKNSNPRFFSLLLINKSLLSLSAYR